MLIFTMEDAEPILYYLEEMRKCLDEIMLGERSDIKFGEMMAYLHILRLMQAHIIEEDVRKELDFDMDLDAKYLPLWSNGLQSEDEQKALKGD